MPKISSGQLASELAQFTGSETWHRSINRTVTFTDGVAHFAEQAGAFWLVDILATELPKFVAAHDIVFVTMKVANHKATISALQDKDCPPLWTKRIGYTDCPEGEWKFYVAPGGPQGTVVIMLPSEY